MFESIKRYILNFEAEVFEAMETALQSEGYVIAEYIANEQLFTRGEDGKGKRLKGYTRRTIRIKLSKNQPADRTTLKDKGVFHPSITVTANSSHFIISSNVTHASFLVARYGQDILRPNNEIMYNFINEKVIPILRKKVNDRFAR